MSDSIPRIPRRSKKDDDPKMIGLWKIGRTIGKGSSGRVRIARHSKTGQYAAVKIVSKQMLLNSRMSLRALGEEAERILHGIEREIVIMKLIEHPNIMRLYDVWETSTELYLILEYVEGGELFEYLCDQGRLSTSEALGYFQQVMTAVHYCHRFNIAHRDLKPENLLLDANKNIKVADFGMAAWQGKSDMLQTACGSPHYAAPEVIMGRAYNGAFSDVWSCGVVLYALLHGRLPFDDEDLPCLLEKVKIGKFTMPNGTDPRAKDLISKMLEKDVNKRITVAEILKHPFYTSQAPKVMPCDVPSLDDIARPLASVGAIDPDILANLKTLWPGVSDVKISENLINDKQTWEKGVYHLLDRYRAKQLENYDDEEERLAERRREKKANRREQRARIAAENIPPRTGPPTPRRARRANPSDSPTAPRRLRQVTAIGSDIFAPEASNTSEAASHLPPVVVPEIQDKRIQLFFHQIVEHLNVMQNDREGPNESYQRNPMNSPMEVKAPPPTPLTLDLDLGTPFNVRNGRQEARSMPSTTDTFEQLSGSSKVTRPLSIRRREPKEVHLGGDKENADTDCTYLTAVGPERKTSFRSDTTENSSTRRERHVHILEPPSNDRSKLRKKRSVARSGSPSSSAFSASDGGSFSFSSTPKRSWFGNIFRFGPATYQLVSTQDSSTTRMECRRILKSIGVSVTLIQIDGMGMFKCALEEFRDPAGFMPTVKAVKFRVEMKLPTTVQALAGYTVSVNLVMEKGAISTFRTVYGRLRKEWDLDVHPKGYMMEADVSEPSLGDERFVEVTYTT